MERNALREQLAQLEQRISEVKSRLPAHSTKPPIMMELLALEDERDRLQALLVKAAT